MLREQVLEQAKQLTTATRQDTYGPPQENWSNIAKLQATWIEIRKGQGVHSPFDAIVEMILVKLARLAHSPDHFDSWVDIAGYAALGAELTNAKVPGKLYPTSSLSKRTAP